MFVGKLGENTFFQNINMMKPHAALPQIPSSTQFPQRDRVQIGSCLRENNNAGIYHPSQMKPLLTPKAQQIASDDEMSLLNVPRLLPPSERSGDYTEQDAILNQYMKQYRIEGYFEGDKLIQTSEDPARLILSENITAEELEQFQNKLVANGLGDEIDWTGVEADFIQMGVNFDNADRFEQKADYLASRYAVLKDRIQTQYTDHKQELEMQKLEQVYNTAKEEMATAYAESIGGFYEELGQTGVADNMRESVLAVIDNKADEYSAHLAQNDIYSSITAPEKQWLKQDDAYMAAQLRSSISTIQTEIETQAAHRQTTYSANDLQFAGMYASELSHQVGDMLMSAGVFFGEWYLSDMKGDDSHLGNVLAEQYQVILEEVANASISDTAASLIKNSFEPFIEKFLNALDTKIDENRIHISKKAWQVGLIRTQHIDRDIVYDAFQAALNDKI